MDFIRDNLSTIIVGALVSGALGLALFRLIRAARRGQNACGCGDCAGCAGRNKAAGPPAAAKAPPEDH